MEKIQTLLWILLGLGVFIWRMVQKARATTQQERQERRYSRPDPEGRPRPVAPGLPATSFEELLRQMQAQNRTDAPKTAETTTPAGRPLPREAAPPARSLEERPKPVAKSLETTPQARSLEVPLHEARRAADLSRASTRPATNDYWARQQAHSKEPARSVVTDQLRRPADLRAAFILSEILKPKF
ncbi:hypothetical protein [Hymenobacter psychrotolerans]|uniref:Uncharacterized protein n=1 Tax=Hymenobacter psychrotolerans DSM 18569 TaxID=1121959 RepID=A0A1M6UT41_9BACT|nr:hypothetical protein [Hymenobacter psychrotolerans]SHK72380.1 hypothetical protein SAMN02746009_01470 [Hymenobacter psychrotolerans DSM 18569]